MARIRTIKPEFFTSEDVVSLSPLARLFFQACWCEADREGRLEWKPRTMKLRYFPADDCNIDALAAEVVNQGIVVLYSVEGKQYANIPSFLRHQHINPREAVSTIPPPDDGKERVNDASARVDDAQVGKEGKGKEGKEGASGTRKQPRAQKTSIPEDFSISERVREWAQEKGHSRLEEHLESFKAKSAAKAYQYVDWDSAFMEAVRENWAKLPAEVLPSSGPQRPHAPIWKGKAA